MKQTNIINFTLVLFLGFLFISCTGAQKKLKSQDIPSWFLSSPAQDKNNLYGTSSAYSLEQAKKQALNNISSYLSIEIQSSTEIQKNSGNGYYNHNISQNISTNTKKLQFTNTKIIKDTIINSKYYVLVQVNKNKLFDENKNILLNSDKNINNLLFYSLIERDEETEFKPNDDDLSNVVHSDLLALFPNVTSLTIDTYVGFKFCFSLIALLNVIFGTNLNEIIITSTDYYGHCCWTKSIWNSDKEILEQKYAEKGFRIAMELVKEAFGDEYHLKINKL